MNKVTEIKPEEVIIVFYARSHIREVCISKTFKLRIFENSVHELFKVCTKQAIYNMLEKLLGGNNAIQM